VFSALPFLWVASRVRPAAPICATTTFAERRFLPVSGFNQELVNSIAGVVQPQAGSTKTRPSAVPASTGTCAFAKTSTAPIEASG